MTTLTTRAAKIGNAIKVHKKQAANDQKGDLLSALAIPITDVMLDEREFNALMGEANAYNAFFDRARGMAEPVFKNIKPLALDTKFDSASIEITHGVAAEKVRLAPVRLSKIKLAPQVGGLVQMDLIVTCTPNLDESAAHLLGQLDSTVDVEIDFGTSKADQSELPLNKFGDDEEAPAAKRRRGRAAAAGTH